MRLSASDIYGYYRPSQCWGRIALREQGLDEAPPGPYDEVVRRLGQDHEQRHLQTFPTVVDLRRCPFLDRPARTMEAIRAGAPVVYQGLLIANVTLGGVECQIVGIPDFLILEGRRGCIVRDSKISRQIDDKEHPEILRQMSLYGWLYQQVFQEPPLKLQVHSGTGEIVEVTYDRGASGLELLEKIVRCRQAVSESYHPVGWSKCIGCGFHDYCWQRAEASQDVALLPGVDQGLAQALHEQGVASIRDLLTSFDEDSLADFRRPWGDKLHRVGKAAGSILMAAQAMISGKETIIARPALPDCGGYVMFDLEGLPPHLDETEKIYLWGMQVFGENQGEYTPAVAGFGSDGDREGWEDFLAKAGAIFKRYGDIPFVHWASYERGRLKTYVGRFGDPDGIAARVQRNLLDLLPVMRNAVVLPLPSYSLKVVEQYVGFQRTQEEYGGNWSMAKYIEAVETVNEQQRAEVMDEILTYNQEDLEATWAVLEWLRAKA
jgi:predicted RecB family nuclease